ncbi:glycosyltransferase family 4 protein [Pelagibacterium limicola]|uniref:glycosyltransferase family 4 protein n=1 Tax=Pelagibacterium limicola TaxID=2791022 RepID=UPI0018AFBCE5|nr:glycosyltransferase family 4 protein [Pelagibacterium limicola]
MRILQIMRAPVGGLFRHVADLTEALAGMGHEVGVVVDSLAGDAQTEARLAALSAFATFGIHRMPMPRVLGVQDVITPLRIRKLARDLGVTILHGHGAKGGFGARLARVGNSRVSALYTPHGGVLHFDTRSASGAVFMAIERSLLGATDAIIFESAYGQRVFAEKIAAPRCRNAVIHNGLRKAEFEMVTPAADAADFVFVGELRLLKGIDLLVAALAQLDRPATLVMAGAGPDEDHLRALIAQHGLADRVSLAGVQPARSMFAAGKCVVVPSRAESLPYIVLEAAAAGRPLIATDVGGIAEIFGPTSPALIAPDATDALRYAMQSWLDSPAKMETDAGLRRAHIAEHFSVERMATDIATLYAALAKHE